MVSLRAQFIKLCKCTCSLTFYEFALLNNVTKVIVISSTGRNKGRRKERKEGRKEGKRKGGREEGKGSTLEVTRTDIRYFLYC